MAANLLKGLAEGIDGYDKTLTVHNRTLSKADPLKDKGAEVADSLGALAACDVVFAISSNDASAEQVWGLGVLRFLNGAF